MKKSCWLNNFNLEYVQANFNHEGKRLHKKKMKTKIVKSTGKKRKFDVGKKEVQDANNARNRDAFSVTKSNNILDYCSNSKKTIENVLPKNLDPGSIEDAVIDVIDFKKLNNIK